MLVISWTGKAHEKGYWDLVEPPKLISGDYVADSKKKTYAFTADAGSKKQLAEYLKDAGFSVALWNLIGPDANVITMDGKPLTQRTLKDNEWEIAQWNVNRALTVNKGLFDKAPLEATEVGRRSPACCARRRAGRSR